MGRIVRRSAVALALMIAVSGMSQSNAKPAANKPAPGVSRGRYLVVNVGMCGDCHTPVDSKGRPLKGQYLQGAPILFKSTIPVPGWMAIAPQIAGLPGWTDDQGIEFLMTGKKPDGAVAAPPMPAFRFNKADATAIVTYLKSLGTEAAGK